MEFLDVARQFPSAFVKGRPAGREGPVGSRSQGEVIANVPDLAWRWPRGETVQQAPLGTGGELPQKMGRQMIPLL